MSGPTGPVAFTSEGLAAWEEAATKLLRDRTILDRFGEEEFWSVLGSMTVAAATSDDPVALVSNGVGRLRGCDPALTIILVANVAWGTPPLAIGNFVIGNAGHTFVKEVNRAAGRRRGIPQETADAWLKRQIASRTRDDQSPTPVALACWTRGQQALAHDEAERALRNLVDLCVLLETDLPAHRVYRRGDTNRPGVRGLRLDRGAIEEGLSKRSRIELASFPLVLSDLTPARESTQWFNTEPLPLGELLGQEELRTVVRSCFAEDPISNRIRVAARWFAEAHYTLADDDAALALGVALDALLSGQRALPGSAMADRFALLEPEASERRERVKAYLDFYGVRSSVAHGGRSSRLDQKDFVSQYQAAVRWAALQTVAMRDKFTPSSEKQVDELFDDLRWGARSW